MRAPPQSPSAAGSRGRSRAPQEAESQRNERAKPHALSVRVRQTREIPDSATVAVYYIRYSKNSDEFGSLKYFENGGIEI